jgi:hypothetical protein
MTPQGAIDRLAVGLRPCGCCKVGTRRSPDFRSETLVAAMGKYSIGFVVLVLVFGMFLGAALGSLLQQVFGFGWLNQDLFSSPVEMVRDFYIIERLEVQLTPGSLLGLIAAGWILYKKGKR